jgi:hypothetical protein
VRTRGRHLGTADRTEGDGSDIVDILANDNAVSRILVLPNARRFNSFPLGCPPGKARLIASRFGLPCTRSPDCGQVTRTSTIRKITVRSILSTPFRRADGLDSLRERLHTGGDDFVSTLTAPGITLMLMGVVPHISPSA